MTNGYGWVIWLFRKSIRSRFTSSRASPSWVVLIRPCFCLPEGPFSQFYSQNIQKNKTLWIQSSKNSPVFILFTKINAMLFCRICVFSSCSCTNYQLLPYLSPTRMKSISFRIFLCSLQTWISWVISGLMETSLELSRRNIYSSFLLTMIELFGISTSYRSGHHTSTDSRICA